MCACVYAYICVCACMFVYICMCAYMCERVCACVYQDFSPGEVNYCVKVMWESFKEKAPTGKIEESL